MNKKILIFIFALFLKDSLNGDINNNSAKDFIKLLLKERSSSVDIDNNSAIKDKASKIVILSKDKNKNFYNKGNNLKRIFPINQPKK